MAFDLPASPSEGQRYDAPGGPSYVFNSPVWKAVGQGQIAIISDTPPSNPANGALWFRSSDGTLLIWMNDGNSSQWVQVGGISGSAPPSDGGEYVMVNGVWRLSKQGFNLVGLSTLNMTVPSWNPSTARLTMFVSNGTHTLRLSADGTTFFAGASDYAMGGFYHATGTAAFQNIAWASQANWNLTTGLDHPTIPVHSTADIRLCRDGGAHSIGYTARGDGYNTSASALLFTHFYHGTCVNAALTDRVAALQWNNTTAATSGRMTVEWLP